MNTKLKKFVGAGFIASLIMSLQACGMPSGWHEMTNDDRARALERFATNVGLQNEFPTTKAAVDCLVNNITQNPDLNGKTVTMNGTIMQDNNNIVRSINVAADVYDMMKTNDPYNISTNIWPIGVAISPTGNWTTTYGAQITKSELWYGVELVPGSGQAARADSEPAIENR